MSPNPYRKGGNYEELWAPFTAVLHQSLSRNRPMKNKTTRPQEKALLQG